MSSISYPMRISEQLMTLAELRSREEHVDKNAFTEQGQFAIEATEAAQDALLNFLK